LDGSLVCLDRLAETPDIRVRFNENLARFRMLRLLLGRWLVLRADTRALPSLLP